MRKFASAVPVFCLLFPVLMGQATETPLRSAPVAPSTTVQPAPDDVVYVTNTGTKYHRAGCRYLAKSSHSIALKDAGAYGPCSVCNPPRLQGQSMNQPAPSHTGVDSGDRTASGKTIYTGPRGGRYTISKSGKKVYQRKKK